MPVSRRIVPQECPWARKAAILAASSFLGISGFGVKQRLRQLACVALHGRETQILVCQTPKAEIASGSRDNDQQNSNRVLRGFVLSFSTG
jgi:hypothetical protein